MLEETLSSPCGTHTVPLVKALRAKPLELVGSGQYLQAQRQLAEGPPHLRQQQVHALALLEADQDVGASLGRLRRHLRHVVLLRKLLQDLLYDRLDLAKETHRDQ